MIADRQYKKANALITLILFDNIIDLNKVQFSKDLSPIDVTLSGIMSEVKDVHE